jgi:histidine ammonia-lyase
MRAGIPFGNTAWSDGRRGISHWRRAFKKMQHKIVLRSGSDMTLAAAERLAFDRAQIELGEEAVSLIGRGRVRFETYLAKKGGYIYGSTTAPGSRAKVMLTKEAGEQQGQTLRNFIALRAGVGGEMLSERCVRLALFARLSNSMTGCGKLRVQTAQAIAALLQAPPAVPLQGVACSGEVMPLTWLMAPLAELPLAIGEAMALVNGSPFATAMACDVALTAGRRIKLAERIFALSIEAAECPAAHFEPRLGDHWRDPYYRQSLGRLHALLADSQRKQLKHQAPTSWRVLPNVLASALQALEEVSCAAQIGLQAVKDNPTFLCGDEDGEHDLVVSSGGYHDHRAGKAIDQVNSILMDLCVLASRHVAHLLDGAGLGLPALLAQPGDRVGAEYLSWGMIEPLASARAATAPTTLDVGVHDPAGDQSDIASLGFIAYGKHRAVARSFDVCFASLAIAVALALDFREAPLPSALRVFGGRLREIAKTAARRSDVSGEPLRKFHALLRAGSDEMTSAEFADFVSNAV